MGVFYSCTQTINASVLWRTSSLCLHHSATSELTSLFLTLPYFREKDRQSRCQPKWVLTPPPLCEKPGAWICRKLETEIARNIYQRNICVLSCIKGSIQLQEVFITYFVILKDCLLKILFSAIYHFLMILNLFYFLLVSCVLRCGS